jgi:hypothetical protein
MQEKLHERVFSAFSGRFGNRPSQGCRSSSFVETRLEHQTNFLIALQVVDSDESSKYGDQEWSISAKEYTISTGFVNPKP